MTSKRNWGVLSKGLLVLRKKLLLRREDLLSLTENLVLLEEIRYFYEKFVIFAGQLASSSRNCVISDEKLLLLRKNRYL